MRQPLLDLAAMRISWGSCQEEEILAANGTCSNEHLYVYHNQLSRQWNDRRATNLSITDKPASRLRFLA